MTRLLTAALAAVGLIVLTQPAAAQVATTGSIEVVVVDQSGARLPGVLVTASATDTVTRRTAVTSDEGVATLEALAPSARYSIETELTGFSAVKQEQLLVRSGQMTSVRITLALATLTEQVQVSVESPVIDVTRAVTGQDITLELTEALPTGRSYQSYLQLVPGVLPDDPQNPGNPAARAGLNYRDIEGDLGVSRDNIYYFDGINVTDPVQGTFGANLNTEIIQEQKVITGGIPAEFVGVPGLLSNVITKSGSNTFHGSVNYFFQNDQLVAENENGQGQIFSTRESAFTLGGPALKDRAWFFGSFRYLKRSDDVLSLDTNTFLRSVDNVQKQGFAKGTWSPTTADLASFTYISDPTDISGRRERDITNERDRRREQGGNNYSANYTRVWNNLLFESAYHQHEGEISDFSTIRAPSNDVAFQEADVRTIADEQLGGYGLDFPENRDTRQVRGSLQYNVGKHSFKGGVEWSQYENHRDLIYFDSAQYTSISNRYLGAGVTAANIAGATGNTWTDLQFDPTNTSDFGGFIRTIDGLPNRAQFYNAFDTNRNGMISQSELGAALVFNSTAGNPNNQISYDRLFQSALGPQDTSSEGVSFFVQDQWRPMSRLTLNLGVRAERWEHFATTGDNIFTFDWAVAPRLSAAFDLLGDGRHKVTGYYGRYYDPIRNNMTNFAGTLTGSVREEQVYALGQWVTYRTRGGLTQQDAFFAPTTKTPYTDDYEVGYGVDLGQGMSFDAVYWNRRTRDILEDYDLGLYADPAGYPGPIDAPDSLYLGLDYFGYSQNPGSNFVIATLEGGKRNFQGVEVVFRKRFRDRWQSLVSYNWNDGEGNTNSDSNADFQGDVIWLDPRAPNQFGTQPGVIRNLVKGGASYTFDMGLQFGGTFNWNSGTVASRTFRASSRNLPVRVTDPFDFAGITTRWLAPDAVGSLTNPSYGTVDLRAQYIQRLNGGLTAELFADIFNVFDNQGAVRNQDLVAGLGDKGFGDAISWLTPRRAFLGARLRF